MSDEARIRYMRAIVFFDLPVTTAVQRKRYAQFRKFLIKDGFLMMQQSVYAKLLINNAAYQGMLTRLRNHRPPEGLVQVLKVTERQFASMSFIVGSRPDREEADDLEEFVVL